MTMEYSFNRDREGIIFAHMKDINASFKDLCAVCDSIRYKPVPAALSTLDEEVAGAAVLYKRHNKHMGTRHELGGRQGRYPMKCAAIVRKALLNAMANSRNKGFEPDVMFVVHASANKTNIMRMSPPKGKLFIGGSYGYSASRHTDIEWAKLELGIAKGTEKGLSERMKRSLKHSSKAFKPVTAKPQQGKALKGKDAKPQQAQQRPKVEKPEQEKEEIQPKLESNRNEDKKE